MADSRRLRHSCLGQGETFLPGLGQDADAEDVVGPQVRCLVVEAHLDGEVAGLRLGLLGDVFDLPLGLDFRERIRILLDRAAPSRLPNLEAADHARRNETEDVDLVIEVDDLGDLSADGERLSRHNLDSADSTTDGCG